MTAAAGVRMPATARGHITRSLADCTWPCPATLAPCRSLPRPSLTSAGASPLQRQHFLTATVCRPATPHQRRPLVSSSICAAAKANEAAQTVPSAGPQRRAKNASADPRDQDDDVDSAASSSSSGQRQRAGAPAAAAAATAAASPSPTEEEGLAEDGFLDDGEEGEEGELGLEEGEEGDEAGYDEGEDEDEDEGEGDDYAASFLEPDDAPREVVTGGTPWGEVVLRAAQGVLAQPAMKGLDLYLFRALPASRKVDIRLDKLDDLYGSPSIDDIERFQRGLFAALDREMGPEAAGEISFEVSSPGAERLVRVPDELTRFAELPLKVEYRGPDGKDTSSVLLLTELDAAVGSSSWRLANVRANATVKGRALSKRQLSQLISIPLADIGRVRIHVDF